MGCRSGRSANREQAAAHASAAERSSCPRPMQADRETKRNSETRLARLPTPHCAVAAAEAAEGLRPMAQRLVEASAKGVLAPHSPPRILSATCGP